MHLTWLGEEKAKASGASYEPYARPAWFTTCEDLKSNILCKSGAENRAQYVAQLLTQGADG